MPLIRLQPANARLLVNSIPRGANVTVNGRYRGQSPITLSLAPDVDYEIGLSKAGYGVTRRNLRLESVQNAADQGDLVARRLAGEDVSYSALPWFWSDQYDCKLQIVGLNQGHNRTVVRQGANDASLSIWYYRDDELLAIDAMNEPKSYAFGRKIIEAGINPTPQQVADPATDLKALALGK